MNKEKSCENCRYYSTHYIKKDTSYFNIHSGHCTNYRNKDWLKKKEGVLCEFWEDIAIKKEERKKTIKENSHDSKRR